MLTCQKKGVSSPEGAILEKVNINNEARRDWILKRTRLVFATSKRRLVKSNARCSMRAIFARFVSVSGKEKNAVWWVPDLPKCHSTLFLTTKALPTALVLAHLPLPLAPFSGKAEIGLNRSAAQVNMVLRVCVVRLCVVCVLLFKAARVEKWGDGWKKKGALLRFPRGISLRIYLWSHAFYIIADDDKYLSFQ